MRVQHACFKVQQKIYFYKMMHILHEVLPK